MGYWNDAFAAGTVSAWASAAGTFGAVVAAVRLARKADERSMKQAEDTAKIIAARIAPTLLADASLIRQGAQLIGFPDDGRPQEAHERVAHLAVTLDHLRFSPTNETLLALMPLDSQCARLIASGYGLLDQLRAELSDENIDVLRLPPEKIGHWEAWMEQAGERIAHAAVICEEAGEVPLPDWSYRHEAPRG